MTACWKSTLSGEDGSNPRTHLASYILGDGWLYRPGVQDSAVKRATARPPATPLRWNYVLALPVDGRVWNVRMDDWMYLMDGRTMLNRTAMSKFGIHLGDVTVVHRATG